MKWKNIFSLANANSRGEKNCGDNERKTGGTRAADSAAPKGEAAQEEPHYDLERFIAAQDADYATALGELKAGHKHSHWIWYVFPQQKGLGYSYNSQYYGLCGEGEARAYLAHPILGARLRECCRALLLHKGGDIRTIMGSDIDMKKLETSMRLFNGVSPDDVFAEVLSAFF